MTEKTGLEKTTVLQPRKLSDQGEGSPTIGTRVAMLLFALLYTVAIIYGSLVTDAIEFDGWESAIEFLRTPSLSGPLNPIVVAVNFILYVPLGFFWFLALSHSGRNQFLQFMLILFSLCLLSVVIEVCQTWMVRRESSYLDILANSLGALVGVFTAMVLELIYLQFSGRYRVAQDGSRRPIYQSDSLLAVFCLCYVCISFAHTLLNHVRLLARGRKSVMGGSEHQLVAWSEFDSIGLEFFGSAFYHVVMLFFCGVLTMMLAKRQRSLTPLLLLLVSFTIVLAELLEAHFSSKAFELFDLALGFGGFFLGVLLVSIGPKSERMSLSLWIFENPLLLRLAASGYAIAILVVSCYPFEFSREQWQISWQKLSFIPLRAMQLKSYDVALLHMFGHLLAALPLGVFAYCCVVLAQRKLNFRTAFIRTGLLMLVFFSLIEVVQLAEANRVGSIDSVILCLLGALVGQYFALHWVKFSIASTLARNRHLPTSRHSRKR